MYFSASRKKILFLDRSCLKTFMLSDSILSLLRVSLLGSALLTRSNIQYLDFCLNTGSEWLFRVSLAAFLVWIKFTYFWIFTSYCIPASPAASSKICTISPETQQWWLILDVVSATFKWPGLMLCAASKRIHTWKLVFENSHVGMGGVSETEVFVDLKAFRRRCCSLRGSYS